MTADTHRLRWQCRRGMLELDYILEAFLDQSYPALAIEEQKAFEQLLATADPELHGWLLGGIEAPPTFQSVVEKLQGGHTNHQKNW